MQRATRFSADDRVAGYRLIKHLGSGGAAEVWAAQPCNGLPRAFALKLLTPTEDQRELAAFLDEARTVALLHHPAVVPVVDVGVAESGPYLVMELVRGPTLAMVLRHQAELGVGLPPSALCVIGERVASVLDHAWNSVGPNDRPLCLVHRDISPQNLLFDAWGGVYVTDFGAARSSHQLHRSVVGSVVGKPSYMAPEQAEGGPVDVCTDVHALGVVLYECATARRLFDPHDPRGLLRVLREHRPPPLSSLFPGYPHRLSDAISRCLEKSPADRWQSAAALAQEFRVVAHDLGGLEHARGQLRAQVNATFAPESFEIHLEPPPAVVEPPLRPASVPPPDRPSTRLRPRAWVALTVGVAVAAIASLRATLAADEPLAHAPVASAVVGVVARGDAAPTAVESATRTPAASALATPPGSRAGPSAAASVRPSRRAPPPDPPSEEIPSPLSRRSVFERIQGLGAQDPELARTLFLELNEINANDVEALQALDAKVAKAGLR